MVKRVVVGLLMSCLLVALVAGCGDDDGADVRASGEASGSGSGASGSSGSGSGSGTGEGGCVPVGGDLADEADQTVDIELLDYAFNPPEIEVAEGVVTFIATNAGEETHELAVLPGGGDVPFVEPGVPDEDALADAGAFELEGFPAGTSCDATWELDAGDYTLFCIVAAEDGETHYEKGMRGTLTVT